MSRGSPPIYQEIGDQILVLKTCCVSVIETRFTVTVVRTSSKSSSLRASDNRS